MQVYVAGSLADAPLIQVVQAAVESAGHSVIHDWTRGPEATLTNYSSVPRVAAAIAEQDLSAALQADAVLLVLGATPGTGMFIEFGAALADAERRSGKHVAVIGDHPDQSVFYFHPAVRRCQSVGEWLASL